MMSQILQIPSPISIPTFWLHALVHPRDGKICISQTPLPLGCVRDLACFLKRECNVCGLEGRSEHTEVEAALQLICCAHWQVQIREAFGFSGAALAEVHMSVLRLRGHSEAACDICLLAHVWAGTSWSCIQRKCNVMAPYPWIEAEAFGHGCSDHGGSLFIVAEAEAPARLVLPCSKTFLEFQLQTAPPDSDDFVNISFYPLNCFCLTQSSATEP